MISQANLFYLSWAPERLLSWLLKVKKIHVISRYQEPWLEYAAFEFQDDNPKFMDVWTFDFLYECVKNLPVSLYEVRPWPGGRFKNTYELLNLRALNFSPANKIHKFQCMGMIFCVEFQRYPWNSTQNILPIHWKIWLLYNIEILRALRFKSLYAFLKRPPALWTYTEQSQDGEINTLRPRQNGRHFADDIFKCIFLNENASIPIEVSLKFVPKSPINNTPALV